MVEVFNQFDIDQVTMACRQKGAPYGVEFGDLALLSNTRLSLEAAEFARDAGVYVSYHHAVFEAYFTHGRNIGDMEVLLSIAESCGLNVIAMADALEQGVYTERVKSGSIEAKQMGVTAIPAFFIEDESAITGAVAEDRFREVLQRVIKS